MKKDRRIFTDKIIDSHTHCCGFDIYNFVHYQYPSAQDPDMLSHLLLSNSIDNAFVFPLPFSFYYEIRPFLEKSQFIESGLCSFPFESENKNLLFNIKRFSFNRFLPFLCFSLNNKVDEQIEGMQKMINDNFVYGLKYHTFTDRNSVIEINKFPQLLDFILENDLPIIVHSGNAEISDAIHVLDFAEMHPNIRICVAHIAKFRKVFFDRYLSGSYKNVYFDIAPFLNLYNRYINTCNKTGLISLPNNDPHQAMLRVFNIAPDRVLWGSDLPYLHTDKLDLSEINVKVTYADEVNLLRKLNDVMMKKIASQNALDFLFGTDYNVS